MASTGTGTGTSITPPNKSTGTKVSNKTASKPP
jgi:hypothetical protein